LDVLDVLSDNVQTNITDRRSCKSTSGLAPPSLWSSSDVQTAIAPRTLVAEVFHLDDRNARFDILIHFQLTV